MEVITDDGIQEKREEINKWLNLPYLIAELEHDKATFSQNYYSEHSFYSHIVYDDDRGIISEAPRVDKVAINLADACLVKDRHIKRIREQYTLFMECLSRLPTNEVETLKTHYLGFDSYLVFTKLDETIYKIIEDIKKITESINESVKMNYQQKLKNRMEQLK